MSTVHRASWLVFGLILVLLPPCYSQNEMLLRSVRAPYPLSFNISQITGSSETYGPTDSTDPGKFFRTLMLHDRKLFVGGKAQLFSAYPANLSTCAIASFVPDMSDNYIRVIQPLPNGTLLECGTYGMNPYCQRRSSEDLSTMGSKYDFSNGQYVVPSQQHQNANWLLVNGTDTQIFAGTNLAITAGSLSDPAIVRARLETDSSQTTVEISLKTKNSPLTVLNGPQFIGDPIDYNEHIFFFYREFASEYMDGYGDEVAFARVAIVCKNDTGGRAAETYSEGDMVTFAKARLVCSIAGEDGFDYHYNEIQDIYQSTNGTNVVYAIFTSGLVDTSAVCAYRLDEIEALFQTSQFRGQQNNEELWTTTTTDPATPRQTTCPDGTGYSAKEYMDILNLGQLMADTAANKLHYESPSGTVRSNPLLVSYGERFSQIVVDKDELNSIDVMFIGTENGTVLKAYLNDSRSGAIVVEEISLNADGKAPVLTMLKSADKAVFVGTDIGVYKIPFQHCQDFPTLQTCLDARDPYCRWTGDACRNSAVGSQDLENGAGAPIPDTPSNITIHTCPKGNTLRSLNISNQPIPLYLVAEADETENLRVVDREIRCSPYASLPFTEYRCRSSGRELLILHIDGSSVGDQNYTCSVNLTIDSCSTKSVHFNFTADSSPALDLPPECLDGLSEYDNSILHYKHEVGKWFEDKAPSCQLQLERCESCDIRDIGGCQ